MNLNNYFTHLFKCHSLLTVREKNVALKIETLEVKHIR